MKKAKLQRPLSHPCHYCGTIAAGTYLHQDHIFPKSKGGKDDPSNLVWACGDCNRTKGNKLLDEAKPFLLMRQFGWPKFTPDQVEWLRSRGLDFSEIESGKLAFERERPDDKMATRAGGYAVKASNQVEAETGGGLSRRQPS